MARWARFVSAVGAARIIGALGGLYVALAAGHSIRGATTGTPPAEALVDLVLIGGPGFALLYGGYWLPHSRFRPEASPRVVGWCLGGLWTMVGVVVLLSLVPSGSVDHPVRALLVASGLGAMAGLGIGIENARALSRAHEAERRQDELRAERNLRERIVETSPVGIVVVDVDRSIRIANERAAEIVGLPREDILELEYDESMLETTDADERPLEDGVFGRVCSTGESVYDARRRMTRPDGRRIWLSVSGAPLRDATDAITAVIFAVEDITERKRLETELTTTVARLAGSNDRLRQFAYAASHDLQEPLRMVSSYLQLLERRNADDLDADAREFIGFAVDGADRMRAMIEDLLAYSRLEQADPAIESVECDVVVERVLSDLRVQIEETDAVITTAALPRVNADEHQLEQLFQNLVSNALKYHGEAPPRIDISAERRTDHWRFSVADNGIGIEPDRAGRIFEVFKRLHSDDEYPGTGIGLSLCQRIVDHHGGRIWVESDPGEGSTFRFTLPLETRTASPETADRIP